MTKTIEENSSDTWNGKALSPEEFIKKTEQLRQSSENVFLVDLSYVKTDSLRLASPIHRVWYDVPISKIDQIIPNFAENDPFRTMITINFKNEGDSLDAIGSPVIHTETLDSINVMDFVPESTSGEFVSPFGFADLNRPLALTWATLPLDIEKILAFLNDCRKAGVSYGLGAKVPRHGAIPGQDFTKIDCSGFVREALWRGTPPGEPFKFPDGSVVQHDWVKAMGFQHGEVDDGALNDGALRIAFLRPADGANGIGHVALVYMGETIESHGGKGPDRREWTGTGWQAKTKVYVLKI